MRNLHPPWLPLLLHPASLSALFSAAVVQQDMLSPALPGSQTTAVLALLSPSPPPHPSSHSCRYEIMRMRIKIFRTLHAAHALVERLLIIRVAFAVTVRRFSHLFQWVLQHVRGGASLGLVLAQVTASVFWSRIVKVKGHCMPTKINCITCRYRPAQSAARRSLRRLYKFPAVALKVFPTYRSPELSRIGLYVRARTFGVRF